MARTDRLKKLAQQIDTIAQRDAERIRQAEQIAALRRTAALDLHGACAAFVAAVNEATLKVKLELSPPGYTNESFLDPGPNLFQINAAGRVIQLTFTANEPMESTENFRTPYILEGAVRWFNQESIEGLRIREHQLFCTLVRGRCQWMVVDRQTNRKAVCDADYLSDRFEELL
ncbi:MAG: hypothetical protein KIT09_24300 [Bryobacteraceae bacterium]|nr:hypothetical protein [Bryobacteraceae bacterium]